MTDNTNFRKILVLAANPTDTNYLRLDQEIRDIEEGLQRSKHRENFHITKKLAVRSRDFRRAILEYRPHVVHFCGHGASDGKLALENDSGKTELLSSDALANLFNLFEAEVECVVLNACYSEVQAEAISKHIDYVVGMRKSVGDAAAIEFSVAFYDALGNGESYEFAYRYACAAIANFKENSTPGLKKKLTNRIENENNFEKVIKAIRDWFSFCILLLLLCVYGHISIQQLIAIYFLLILGAFLAWLNPTLPQRWKFPQNWLGKEPAMILYRKSIQKNNSELRNFSTSDLNVLEKQYVAVEKTFQNFSQNNPDMAHNFPELLEIIDSISESKAKIHAEKTRKAQSHAKYRSSNDAVKSQSYYANPNTHRKVSNHLNRSGILSNIKNSQSSQSQKYQGNNAPRKSSYQNFSTKPRLTENEFKAIINPEDYVYVKGHLRKGSWVNPHYRRKPKRIRRKRSL